MARSNRDHCRRKYSFHRGAFGKGWQKTRASDTRVTVAVSGHSSSSCRIGFPVQGSTKSGAISARGTRTKRRAARPGVRDSQTGLLDDCISVDQNIHIQRAGSLELVSPCAHALVLFQGRPRAIHRVRGLSQLATRNSGTRVGQEHLEAQSNRRRRNEQRKYSVRQVRERQRRRCSSRLPRLEPSDRNTCIVRLWDTNENAHHENTD